MRTSGVNSFVFFIAIFVMLGCSSQKNNKTSDQEKETDTIITQQSASDSSILKETAENKVPGSVNNTNSNTEISFTVIKATSQKWQGGVKGSGGGVNYEVSVITLLPSSQLSIDELWIGETFHETTASRKFPKTSVDGFAAGDTIFLFVSDYRKDPDGPKQIEGIDEQKEMQETKQNTPPPYKYTGEALIGYKINRVRKYTEIAKITVKSPLYYP